MAGEFMKNNVKIKRMKLSIAQGVGVNRQTIGLIENGKHSPSLQLCIAIANELNKTLDDLFWEVVL